MFFSPPILLEIPFLKPWLYQTTYCIVMRFSAWRPGPSSGHAACWYRRLKVCREPRIWRQPRLQEVGCVAPRTVTQVIMRDYNDELVGYLSLHMSWLLILLSFFSPPRHLPMIAGLLHGRMHLNMQEFRQQNHMTFFSNVLAILELLQPLVFHSNHQRALQDCLLSFMKVLQVGSAACFQIFIRGF